MGSVLIFMNFISLPAVINYQTTPYRLLYIILNWIFFFVIFDFIQYFTVKISAWKKQPIKWVYIAFIFLIMGFGVLTVLHFVTNFYEPWEDPAVFRKWVVWDVTIALFLFSGFLYPFFYSIRSYWLYYIFTGTTGLLLLSLIFMDDNPQFMVFARIMDAFFICYPLIFTAYIINKLESSFTSDAWGLFISLGAFYLTSMPTFWMGDFLNMSETDLLWPLILRIVTMQLLHYYASKVDFFAEAGWKQSVVELFILNKEDNELTFYWRPPQSPQSNGFRKKKNSSNPDMTEQSPHYIFSKGLIGINEMVKIFLKTHNINEEMSELRLENRIIFLEHSGNRMYCLVSRRDLFSHRKFLHVVRQTFEKYYVAYLDKMDAEHLTKKKAAIEIAAQENPASESDNREPKSEELLPHPSFNAFTSIVNNLYYPQKKVNPLSTVFFIKPFSNRSGN